MSGNKIEFKILKESSGKHVELTGMSIEAAQSLIKLMTSLTNILSECGDSEKVNIQIIKGSATLVADAPAKIIEEIHKGFDDVVDRKSTNRVFVENWLVIQNLIKSKGLEYEANFYTKSGKIPIVETIRSSRQFRLKGYRQRVPTDTDLVFIKGRLIEVGGKKPNIHVVTAADEKLTINCEEAQAIKVNKFLYQSVMLCAWREKRRNVIMRYSYCDSYINEQTFSRFDHFIRSFYEREEIDGLVDLHNIFREYIEIKDFGNLRKLMRLFKHESLDAATLKTVLVITKAFRRHQAVAETRDALRKILESKVGALV